MRPYQLTPADEKIIDQLFPPVKLDGWLSREKARLIYALVRQYKPRLCVEIGTYGGMSEFAVAFALKENRQGIIYGIDPWSLPPSLVGTNSKDNENYWKGVNWDQLVRRYYGKARDFGLLEWSCHYRRTDAECVDFFDDETVEYIHFDSNHSLEESTATVHRWWHKLTPNCVIVMDDVDWPGQCEAAKLLISLGARETGNHFSYATYLK